MTSGYRVYRHDGWYHVYYNHSNSHPDGLGLWSISEIPRTSQKYCLWLQSLRKKLEHSLEKMMEAYADHRSTFGDRSSQYYITRSQPTKSKHIQWIWELDCDHEILHVDSRPLFCLSNVPRDELFLSSVSFDSYGHRAYAIDTLDKYRYNWKSPSPPVAQSMIDMHAKYCGEGRSIMSRTLFDLPERPGICETICTRLYQTLFGTAMRTWTLSYEIPQLEKVHNRATIPNHLLQFGRAMIDIVLHPLIATDDVFLLPQSAGQQDGDCYWPRHDVCLRFATHLDDLPNLKESICSIVASARRCEDTPPTVYGIAFSFFHIAIVLIKRDQIPIINHTSALQFLPSFFATSPSTPGISALSELAFTLKRSVLQAKVQDAPVGNSLVYTIPTEIWHRIASSLSSVGDLKNLGGLTHQSNAAVNDILRYPHIAGHRLVNARLESVDNYWVAPRWCRVYQEDYFPKDGLSALYSQNFDAVRDDLDGLVVQIGPGDPPLANHQNTLASWMQPQHSVDGSIFESQLEIIPGSTGNSGWSVKYRISRDST